MPSGDVAWTDSARARRFAELQPLAKLLRPSGEKVPDTGLDHSDEGNHVSFDARIPGALKGEQVHALEQSTDREFTRTWLRELIRHEQSAVRIATAEVADGQNAKAVAMARKDKDAHAALVAGLQRLAGS